MATYHLAVVLKVGQKPLPSARFLASSDVAANSDDEAIEYAVSFIDHEVGEFCESLRQTHGEDAANEFESMAAQWQPQVRRVNRPIVDVNPRTWTTDEMRDGVVWDSTFTAALKQGNRRLMCWSVARSRAC